MTTAIKRRDDGSSIAPRQFSPEDIAVAVLVDRIQRLPKESVQDLVSLLIDLQKCADSETFYEITEAMREVIFPELIGKANDGSAGNTSPSDAYAKRMQYIGQKIRDRRKELEMTQEQLAEISGLPQSHISRLEQGRHSPSAKTLEKISQALRVVPGTIDPTYW